jgi:hypothetical protein
MNWSGLFFGSSSFRILGEYSLALEPNEGWIGRLVPSTGIDGWNLSSRTDNTNSIVVDSEIRTEDEPDGSNFQKLDRLATCIGFS